MNIFTTLNLRTEFESIVAFGKKYDLPNHNSDINSLVFFVNEGDKKNRFRKHYDRALEIAESILKEHDGQDTRKRLDI